MKSEQQRVVGRQPWTAGSERGLTLHAIDHVPAVCHGALRDYALWLEEERCLRPGSTRGRVTSARCFVVAVTAASSRTDRSLA